MEGGRGERKEEGGGTERERIREVCLQDLANEERTRRGTRSYR